MERSYETSIVWLRRDLRLRDNVALTRATACSGRVIILFNVDPVLLRGPRMGAPIVHAFFSAVDALRAEVREHGSDVVIALGEPVEALVKTARAAGAQAVFYNEDYEPQARERDARVERALTADGIDVHASLDHVYYGAGELETESGTPYKVFTPYKRRWLQRHREQPRVPAGSLRTALAKLAPRAALPDGVDVPSLQYFGFTPSDRFAVTSEASAKRRLERFFAKHAATYAEDRDVPAADATSHLSVDLRAGTIGIRTCIDVAFAHAAAASGSARHSVETWLSELIWREFYQMILARFPHVAGAPFVKAAAGIAWNDDAHAFAAWCAGETGFPIVDAAMRQLNQTGWMHNRLRMIVASFLTKDLLINWQSGERYFEQHLGDADLAQNNGGWQWAASTGADAVPYFRVFNPLVQSKRFDPDGAFIRKFVPELRSVPDRYIHEPSAMPPLEAAAAGVHIGSTYPAPIVEHASARERALHAYARVLGHKKRG